MYCVAVLLERVAPVRVTLDTPRLSLTLTVKVTTSVFWLDANKVTLVMLALLLLFLPILVILGSWLSVFWMLTVRELLELFPAASVAVSVKVWLTLP